MFGRNGGGSTTDSTTTTTMTTASGEDAREQEQQLDLGKMRLKEDDNEQDEYDNNGEVRTTTTTTTTTTEDADTADGDAARRYVFDPSQDEASGYATVQVMQFNVLADALAANDSFASAYYGEDDDDDDEDQNDGGDKASNVDQRLYNLNFAKSRGADLIRAITTGDASSSPDVVCMQEVDHYYDWFEPELRKHGYAGIFKEDQWSPCSRKFGGAPDGVAIFYKLDKLELVGSHAPGTPRARKDDPMFDAGKTLMARFRMKNQQRGGSLLNRNTTVGALIGGLIRNPAKPVFSGADLQEVVVVNTHLESAKTVDGIITRLEQTKELCRHLNAFATNLCVDVDNVQIILAGDLNATPNEACVVHLRGRGMRSAYEDIGSTLQVDEKAVNTFTTWKTRTGLFKTGEVKHTIDYILYSAHRGSKVVSVAKLPDEKDIPSETGLPTFGFPSDHLPIQARIAIPLRRR